jgi:hypothetical protein
MEDPVIENAHESNRMLSFIEFAEDHPGISVDKSLRRGLKKKKPARSRACSGFRCLLTAVESVGWNVSVARRGLPAAYRPPVIHRRICITQVTTPGEAGLVLFSCTFTRASSVHFQKNKEAVSKINETAS